MDWISVDDRLPEDEGHYLIWHSWQEKIMYKTETIYAWDKAYYEGGDWQIPDSVYDIRPEVRYWMPIDPPGREEA